VISLPALDKATVGMSKPWANGGTTISQTSQDMPQVDSDEAPTAAASELRLLLSQLERGDLPSVSNLKKTISYAADVLSSQNWESGATQKRYSTELKLAHSLPQHAHTYTNKHAHMYMVNHLSATTH